MVAAALWYRPALSSSQHDQCSTSGRAADRRPVGGCSTRAAALRPHLPDGALLLACSAIASASLVACSPAGAAALPAEGQLQQQQQQQQQQQVPLPRLRGWEPVLPELRVLPLGYVGSYRLPGQQAMESPYMQQVAPGVYQPVDPSSLSSRRAQQQQQQQPSVAQQAAEVKALVDKAHEAVRQGEYEEALEAYSSAVRRYPDLAVTEYARLGRALLLYQTGDASQALLELQDAEVALRGYAEVHAAMSAILYVERPSQLARAEQQWELAAEFDKRYSDPSFAEQAKFWPPRAVSALRRFLALT